MFPSDEKTDFLTPCIKLFVTDKSTAGPGMIIATIAMLENNNHVDNSMISCQSISDGNPSLFLKDCIIFISFLHGLDFIPVDPPGNIHYYGKDC